MPVGTVGVPVYTVRMTIYTVGGNGRRMTASAICEVDWDHLGDIVRGRVTVGVWAHFDRDWVVFEKGGESRTGRAGGDEGKKEEVQPQLCRQAKMNGVRIEEPCLK